MGAFDEEYLTVAEIAERLKLNQQTLRNWIDLGQLPAVRIGRRVRVRRSDFERLLQDGYSGATAQRTPTRPASPSAEDFWSGEAISTAQAPTPGNDQPDGDT